MAAPLHAQVPDTTQAAPSDTLHAPVPDTTQATRPPVGFEGPEPGVLIADSIVARTAMLDASALLTSVPGSFLYAFRTPGWPEGWSPYGLNPQRVALLLGGLSFDDPVTGRPRYDLLPFALLEPLRTAPGRLGTAGAVYAQVRPYDAARPLTELRYMSTNTGLQSIYATHTQQRRRSLFGNDGIMGLLFSYGGHAADGEYPGSRLRRMRQLLGRLRYAQATWSVEVTEFHNRRQLGAHGGVLPQPGLTFESIYARVAADVEDPNARRQTIRNDLALTARFRLLSDAPLTVSSYWTAQTFRYRNPGADTLTAKVNRYGGRVHQAFRLGRHRLRLRVEGWMDQFRRSGNAVPAGFDRSRGQLHATARDSLRLGSLTLVLDGGLHATDAATYPGGSAEVAWQRGAVRLFAEAGHTGQPVAWVERSGFGPFVRSVIPLPDGRVTQGRLGLTFRAGAFDLTVFGFGHEATHPLDLYVIAEDTVAALAATEPFRRVGVGADLGWRRDAERGFYLSVQPTLTEMLNADASPLHARQDAALPSFFATGRFGARYLLFNGDLDLDVSLRGRYWTELRSRTLHPPTGLLVLPPADARVWPASGILDVVVEGGVRTATLFVAYENVLSGTQLLVGNLIVPVYPLPERRFRFGVFWPIRN